MHARSVPALLALLPLLAFGCGGSATEPTGVAHGTSLVRTSPSSRPSPSPSPSRLGVPPLEALGWEGVIVRTACLDLELSFGAEVANAIEKGIRNTLTGFGIETIPPGGSCEATLSVTLTGGALGANYGRAGYCYPGVELSGIVTFQGGGRAAVQSAIDWEIDTPLVIVGCPSARTTLCGSAARQVFNHVVNLWDLSQPADPTLGTSYGLHPAGPTPRPLVGGRTNTTAYVTWCVFPATASPSPG